VARTPRVDDDRAVRRLLIAAIATGLLTVAPAGASAAQATIGISDQEAATYVDPLLAWTGITTGRVIVPWDAALGATSRVDHVLSTAGDAGMDILVSFDRHSSEDCAAGPCSLPSPSQYRRAITAFHRRWPYVRTISPWNEANHPSQPTADRPAAAAEFYRIARDVCPECRVLGAEVVDIPNLEDWLRRFKAALATEPGLWGLHNYGDVTRRRSTMTRRMLDLVEGEVWLTETGGLVRFQTRDGHVRWPYDEQRAARSVEYTFALADAHERIRRVYLYNWRSVPWLRWDSGLLSHAGEPRPSFSALAARLRPSQGVSEALRLRLPRARVIRRPHYRRRDGRVLATVACPREHIQRCAVVMGVRTKGAKRRRWKRLGERSLRIRAGHRRVLRVRVPRARRRMIRRGRTRVLRVQLWLGDPRPRQYDVRCKRSRRR
jgi:hypothetical protein